MDGNENLHRNRASASIPEFPIDLWRHEEGEMGALIPLLQSAQETYGYIPEHAIDHISEIVKIPAADIYGVITFYAQFRLKPLGKYVIKLCDGTACHVNGSKNLLNAIQDALHITEDETTDDGLFTLQKVACLGCCSLAPAIMINEETYGRLNAKKIQQILKDYAHRSKEAAAA
ncbi:MAG: NADH-quinone oxidoreductase subunit NuoE [Bacteroidota bacterium]|nr:NADH-quinone oxidoreductase subunit NuoE [Bacteroidota bacterium]